MSGIVGIIHLSGRPVDPADLARMMDVLAHRGSDAEATWQEDSAGFGHRLLHTTPESLHERQPLVGESSNLILVADARIDNREELIRLLGLQDASGDAVTDSRLILAAFEKWGPAGVEKLLGDFAFAVWDKAGRTLFCACDQVGVKQLYYHYVPGKLFAFASEPKALLALEGISSEPDDLHIAEHLMLPVRRDPERTFYKDIKCLPGGRLLKVGSGGLLSQRYWALQPDQEILLSSDEEYAEAFRELFAEAVACRMRSAYPIGAMLSGGLDSSSITSMAATLQARGNVSDNPLFTLSAVYESVTSIDERPYIETVLDKYGLDRHYFFADKVGVLDAADQIQWHADQPVEGGNARIPWRLYEEASRRGARVVLDGFDGDSTVSHGTGYWFELAHAGRWIKLLSEVKQYSDMRGLPWRPAAWTWIRGCLVNPTLARMDWARAIRDQFNGKKAAPQQTPYPLFNPEFIDRVREHFAPPEPLPLTEREAHFRKLTSVSFAAGIRFLTALGAAHQIELRLPFMDVRLMKFALALPPAQKLAGGWERAILRRAMEGILPEAIRWRPGKTDMTPGVIHSLERDEQERMKNVALSNTGNVYHYASEVALKNIHSQEGYGTVSKGNADYVWRFVTTALWLDKNNSSLRGDRKQSTEKILQETP